MKAVFLDYATLGRDSVDPAPLEAVVPGIDIHDYTAPDEVAARLEGATVALANKTRFDAGVIGNSSLEYIGLAATGTDNVDLDAARRHGIAVTNIRDYCSESVAEHVFGVLLQLVRSLGEYRAAVRDGAWQRANTFCLLDFPIRQLSGMTLGIVGHGTLGRAVAERGRAFGMTVLAAARRGQRPPPGRRPFEDVLQQADVVSLHCPLTSDTAGLIGREELRRMKKDAILINTARGGLVDTAALREALERGDIAGAAIDVLPAEPPAGGDPLLHYRGRNLVLTPHVAWAAVEARRAALDEVAANLRAWLAGERRNRLDV